MERKTILLFVTGFLVVVLFLLMIDIDTSTPVYSQAVTEVEGTVPSTYLPVVFNKYSSAIPIFGVQMYGDTSDNSIYHDALLNSGASWLRVDVSWQAVEPTNVSPPDFNWTSIDNNLAAARTDMGGLNLIATIRFAPGWAATHSEGPINSDNLDDFAEFVGALVERYDGDGVDDANGSPKVLYWEFYNEPDHNSDEIGNPNFTYPVRWGDHGAEYATMLQTVYPAVKAADPKAQVVFGGIAYDRFEDSGGPFVREFLDDVLTAGGGNYFDVMNFHYYPAFYQVWTDDEGPGLLQKTEAIRGILTSYGLDKPIVITESGWHDNNVTVVLPGSPEIQGGFVVRLFTQSLVADVDVMIWWNLYDIGFPYPYNTGLVTNADPPPEDPPLEKEPAFGTYQLITNELSQVTYLSTLNTGIEDMEVHQFHDYINERMIYVAWLNPADSTETKSVKIPVTQATIRNSFDGTTTSVSDGDDGLMDGKITVQVTAQPVYIEK